MATIPPPNALRRSKHLATRNPPFPPPFPLYSQSVRERMTESCIDMDREPSTSLRSSGLHRLAACVADSLATPMYLAWGQRHSTQDWERVKKLNQQRHQPEMSDVQAMVPVLTKRLEGGMVVLA